MDNTATIQGTILSISEAARRVGAARSTIQRKIKSGELSATRRPDGSRGVELTELLRVFGELQRAVPQGVATSQRAAGDSATGAAALQVAKLELRVEFLERENADLRRQLEQANERENRLLSLAERQLPAPSWWRALWPRRD